MALQRPRDRRFHSQQPPSILAPPPPPSQLLVAPPQQISPGSFHYYQHQQQHHPQPQPQQQQPSPQQQLHQHQLQHQLRHQVQFYQRIDPILQNPGPAPVPIVDLYRQRPQQQQQQQQPPPFLGAPPPPPHRVQASAWDDRAFRVPPNTDGFNNHNLHRLESTPSNVALENHHPLARLPIIPGYVRQPEGLVHRAPSHERSNSTYWQQQQPFTGTGLYTPTPALTPTPTPNPNPNTNPNPSEVSLLPRGYHHSPSPQRLRERGFLESSGPPPPFSRHFESPRVVNSPPPRFNRARSRSRSRSPVRFNSRVSEYPTSWRPPRKAEEDDEREDGQLTPSSSPEIHLESRRTPERTPEIHLEPSRVHLEPRRTPELSLEPRRASYGSRNHYNHHRGGNQSRVTPQKRDRPGFRESPLKRPRPDDTSSKRSVQKDRDRDSSRSQNLRNKEGSTRKDGGSGNKSTPVKFVPVETAGEISQPPAAGVTPGDASLQDRVEDQGTSKPGDDAQANAGAQVQEVVNLESEPGVEGVDKSVKQSQGLAPETGGGEQAQVPPTAMNTGEKSSEAPAEAPVSKAAPEDQAQAHDQAAKAGALDAQKQAKQAVLTIRKNPSIPVAFKAAQGGSSTSKTWRRNGGILSVGASKVSSVGVSTGVLAGVSQAPSTNTSSLAYVRKGNSLVRAPGAKNTSTTTTPPFSKPSSTPPLRVPVVKIGLKTSKPGENSIVPVVEKPTELENGGAVEASSASVNASVQRENGENNNNSNNTSSTQPKFSPTRVEGSETYYKRKMNQLLLRNASESSGDKREAPALRTRLGKVLRLKKRSLVWTLTASKAPLLLPWKKRLAGRTRTRRLSSLPDGSHGSLLSLISKKLQAFRTSQPLYTRSANGFSLHRSGLRSVAGANLKWTKSLEKRSREANEEATKAVAAVEKRCRRDKAGGKTRERIVMVGLVRYKMDPSTRTLQRLQDSPENSTLPSRKFSALTPRRASIGGALYVRMGNGNQLVRDPKASSRALASEKVRWSLHKVRSRISKKQQYCQFFTRFGRCNKGDSRCPYIHDSDKVVVCTKFLNGTCENSKCLLTHKVIPERMPDCSFFLQGLCINEKCPYRHVNVNPSAPVCEGFLKGYCASGDQCNKKHTHVCPRYASTGECPDRKACKLHHPKKKVCNKLTPSSSSGSKARYFTGELPSHPLAIGSLGGRLNEALKDFIELVPGDELSTESEPDEPSNNTTRLKPHRGLLCFNEMPEEEVDRLIKPAFVWQSRSNQEPVQV